MIEKTAELPKAIIFGESDKTASILFPYDIFCVLKKKSILKEFPRLCGQGTTYSNKKEIVSIQFLVPLIQIPAIRRRLAPYLTLVREKDK